MTVLVIHYPCMIRCVDVNEDADNGEGLIGGLFTMQMDGWL